MLSEPKPRPARLLNCVVITAFGAGLFFVLLPWLNSDAPRFWPEYLVIMMATSVSHFLILYRRQATYDLANRIVGHPIRFFELTYFLIVWILYLLPLAILPYTLGFGTTEQPVKDLFKVEFVTEHMIAAVGSSLGVGAVSGLDIYPVNMFRTKSSLEHLIGITRDLMKLCNRFLFLFLGSILAAWAFQKLSLSPRLLVLATYGAIAVLVGGTAVLGSRLTEQLYLLEEIELDDSACRRQVEDSSAPIEETG